MSILRECGSVAEELVHYSWLCYQRRLVGAAGGKLSAKPLESNGEHAAGPLALEKILHFRGDRGIEMLELAIGGGEIEAEVENAATAFPAAAGTILIGNQMIDAGAQKRAEAGARGIEITEQVFFKEAREEVLGQILRVLGRFAPTQPDVFVDGLPVGSEQNVEGAGALIGFGAARSDDGGPARLRKTAADFTTAVFGVHRVFSRRAQEPPECMPRRRESTRKGEAAAGQDRVMAR